jgi:hypothetical protein
VRLYLELASEQLDADLADDSSAKALRIGPTFLAVDLLSMEARRALASVVFEQTTRDPVVIT